MVELLVRGSRQLVLKVFGPRRWRRAPNTCVKPIGRTASARRSEIACRSRLVTVVLPASACAGIPKLSLRCCKPHTLRGRVTILTWPGGGMRRTRGINDACASWRLPDWC